MRVCSPALGLDPDAHLGGAVYDRELLSAMAAEGVEVDILLPEGERFTPRPHWRVTRTPRHRRSYYEYNWIFFRALRRQWRAAPAEILRVHSPYSIGPGALAFARQTRVPVVLHYLHREPRPLWTAADRLLLRRYASVITISETTRDDLLAHYSLRPQRIVVAYPGVSERFQPAAGRSNGSGLVVLHVGALIPRKNLLNALRAFAGACRTGLEMQFVIAGEGPEEQALRLAAAELQVASRVRFTGRITEEEKIRLYQSSDILLFPSVREGFGMVAAEALACGVPVIGNSRTSTREIVRHGVSGLLVDQPADAEALGAALGELARDPERRRAYGEAGRCDVRQRFSWPRSARQVIEAYRSVLAAERAA
ncbi:MAG TPA: glycosyltransferase family 4 protein [Vicinamibacterales bacterium]|jgi:glycosyltransferase involved in cell wall biosynthesis|nr:glycosyltransferase family 4 protein [Vicinamibacterales bacterium]